MDVIVDIDGTLADCTHRLRHIQKMPKDWDSFFAETGRDSPIVPIVSLVQGLVSDQTNRVIYVSGRPTKTKRVTVEWLYRWGLVGSKLNLYMRHDGDHRDDQILKRELLSYVRADGFNPVLAIDDRKRVVDMWRAEGLICMQVAEGDF